MPNILAGDEDRLSYILTCLLKTAVERNRKARASKVVNLRVYAAPETQIDLRNSYDTYEFPVNGL